MSDDGRLSSALKRAIARIRTEAAIHPVPKEDHTMPRNTTVSNEFAPARALAPEGNPAFASGTGKEQA
jgi:hypothetical protein